jgi:hypothetical protein
MTPTERTALWETVRVPDWLQSDTEESRAWRLDSSAISLYTPWLPDEQGRLYSAALDIAIEVTQPLLGVRDRDGRLIETAVAMARRLEAMEQRRRDLEQG